MQQQPLALLLLPLRRLKVPRDPSRGSDKDRRGSPRRTQTSAGDLTAALSHPQLIGVFWRYYAWLALLFTDALCRVTA